MCRSEILGGRVFLALKAVALGFEPFIALMLLARQLLRQARQLLAPVPRKSREIAVPMRDQLQLVGGEVRGFRRRMVLLAVRLALLLVGPRVFGAELEIQG